jgi:hypothetical protein
MMFTRCITGNCWSDVLLDWKLCPLGPELRLFVPLLGKSWATFDENSSQTYITFDAIRFGNMCGTNERCFLFLTKKEKIKLIHSWITIPAQWFFFEFLARVLNSHDPEVLTWRVMRRLGFHFVMWPSNDSWLVASWLNFTKDHQAVHSMFDAAVTVDYRSEDRKKL